MHSETELSVRIDVQYSAIAVRFSTDMTAIDTECSKSIFELPIVFFNQSQTTLECVPIPFHLDFLALC